MSYFKYLSLLIVITMSAVTSFAQSRVVSGKVIDNEGAPIIGASVIIKGTTKGASSDMDGNYSIYATTGDILVFSDVASIPQEITVGKESTINVKLMPDTKTLDEVIVVAYGTSKKSSFTGSADVISSKSLDNHPITEVTKSLDGKVAGVMTTSGSGQPGSGAGVMIRGFGSINASSSPLIVVDGMPYDGDLNSLNSADIESMTVLKDASAGALYGARGANGVLMITTKKAKDYGKVNVDFSSKWSLMSRAIPRYETTDSKDYLELMYNAFNNDLTYKEGYLPSVAKTATASKLASELFGAKGIYDPYDVSSDNLFDADGHIVSGASLKYNEDWIKTVTASMPIRQEYQVSLSGNSPASKYLISLSYLNEDGLLKTTDFSRYTLRASEDFNVTKWLDAGLNIGFAHTNSDFLGADGSTNSNIWYSAQMIAPIYPVYQLDADGNYVLDASGAKQFDYGTSRPGGAQNNKNSIATLYDDDYYNKSDAVSARSYLRASWKGFQLSTNLGLDNSNTNESTNYNRYNGDAAGTGRLTKEYERVNSYTWNQLLNYSTKYGKHSVDAMVGHEFYGFRSNYLNGERTGFPFGEYDELAMGSTITQAYSQGDKYYIDSYLSRLNYNYADKYYFSGSFRTDASSRFEKSHRWGQFWSVGASWRISEEKFLDTASWLDNLTLKASYGVQGNDNIGTYYAWQQLYNMNYANASYSGAMISSLENKNISWESNGNFNLGAEFKMLKRISGSLELYDRMTSDLLLKYPKAASSGIDGYYANVGKMSNKGIDLTVNATIIHNQDWDWNVTAIASTVKNKIKKLTGGEDNIVNSIYIDTPGEAVNSFYMAKSAGVDPVTGKQLYWAYKKDSSGNMIDGSEYITDDSQVAANSKFILGSRIPKLYGSFSNGLKFGKMSFDMMLAYSWGGKVFDSVYQSMMEPSFVGQTYHKNAMRSWKQAGDITDVPRILTTSVTATNDRYLIDASYFSIKNLTLSYDLSDKVAKAKISNLRVYLSVDNLFMFTNLKGMNPQASFSGSTSFSYVPTRSITCGIDIKL